MGRGEIFPTTAREDLDMIVRSGRRLGSLVDDILDFSKLSKEHLELNTRPGGSLRSFGAGAAAFAASGWSKSAAAQERGAYGFASGAGGRKSPATDSPQSGGQRHQIHRRGEVEVSAVVEGDLVEVRVKDTGIGIPSKQQQQIFEAFQQADATSERAYGGTGLGLAVTRQLVALHGGTLWVESAPGERIDLRVHVARFFGTLARSFTRERRATPPVDRGGG